VFTAEEISLPTTSRRVFLGGSVAMAAVALAGCRKAAGGGGTAGRLTVGIPSDVVPANLLRQVAVNFPVRALVFDTLVMLDKQTRRVLPHLATAWSWNSDQTELKVQLRNDVKFHTGRPFGPKDVQFSIKTAADVANGSPVAAITRYIKSVGQTGPAEVTFTLTSAVGNFLDLLLLTPIVDSETIGELKSGKKVVGTGPFVWKSWVPGTRLDLAKNPAYWNHGEPYADRVVLRVFTQSSALAAALRSGQVDMAHQIVPRDAAAFLKDGSYQVISTKPTYTDWYVGVNVTVDPFTDVRVRQAAAWALDRERIARQVFAGMGTASCLPALDTFPGLTAADNTHYGHDPAKARRLLAAVGKSLPVVPLVANGNNPTAMSILNIVQYDLEAVGFKIRPNALDSATYQSQVQKAAVRGLWVGPLDTESVSIATVAMGNPPFAVKGNTSHVSDPAYAKLVAAVIKAATGAEKAKANRAYMDYVLDQAFHLTLTHGYYVAVMKKGLSGVATTGTSDLDLSGARP